MRTEKPGRTIGNDSNALASSIVLVCRKRPADAPMCTRREFVSALRRELRPALAELQRANIAPVDLAQSAIGPGIGVYSRYAQVLDADGSPMGVRAALQLINEELDAYFNEQSGDLDRESRFCLELYRQSAFNDVRYGEAEVLATAKNVSIAAMEAKGLLRAERGVVCLLPREELNCDVAGQNPAWLTAQQLAHTIERDGIQGCARLVAALPADAAERAKALAYQLFTLADKRGWTAEALAYNALVVSWSEVAATASSLRKHAPVQTHFDL